MELNQILRIVLLAHQMLTSHEAFLDNILPPGWINNGKAPISTDDYSYSGSNFFSSDVSRDYDTPDYATNDKTGSETVISVTANSNTMAPVVAQTGTGTDSVLTTMNPGNITIDQTASSQSVGTATVTRGIRIPAITLPGGILANITVPEITIPGMNQVTQSTNSPDGSVTQELNTATAGSEITTPGMNQVTESTNSPDGSVTQQLNTATAGSDITQETVSQETEINTANAANADGTTITISDISFSDSNTNTNPSQNQQSVTHEMNTGTDLTTEKTDGLMVTQGSKTAGGNLITNSSGDSITNTVGVFETGTATSDGKNGNSKPTVTEATGVTTKSAVTDHQGEVDPIDPAANANVSSGNVSKITTAAYNDNNNNNGSNLVTTTTGSVANGSEIVVATTMTSQGNNSGEEQTGNCFACYGIEDCLKRQNSTKLFQNSNKNSSCYSPSGICYMLIDLESLPHVALWGCRPFSDVRYDQCSVSSVRAASYCEHCCRGGMCNAEYDYHTLAKDCDPYNGASRNSQRISYLLFNTVCVLLVISARYALS